MIKRSYLITGGFGLIGSTLVNTLQGDTTIISRSEKNRQRLKKKPHAVILKDLSTLETHDIPDVDIIYHCASTVDNYNVLTDPYIDSHVNIDGTLRLLELIKKKEKKPKIIFLSTFFVYGNTYDKIKKAITETSPTDPLAIYPATKLCAESIIKLYAKLYDIPYLICRLTNVYGEEENFDNKKKGALNFLIMNALKGETINLYKGGNFYRDYIHTSDVVSALRFLEERAKNDTFLIGYGKPVLFKDIIHYVLNNTGNKSKVVEIDPPQFHKIVGITNFVANTSKLNTLGWKASIDYKQGLQKVIDRYKLLI